MWATVNLFRIKIFRWRCFADAHFIRIFNEFIFEWIKEKVLKNHPNYENWSCSTDQHIWFKWEKKNNSSALKIHLFDQKYNIFYQEKHFLFPKFRFFVTQNECFSCIKTTFLCVKWIRFNRIELFLSFPQFPSQYWPWTYENNNKILL